MAYTEKAIEILDWANVHKMVHQINKVAPDQIAPGLVLEYLKNNDCIIFEVNRINPNRHYHITIVKNVIGSYTVEYLKTEET